MNYEPHDVHARRGFTGSGRIARRINAGKTGSTLGSYVGIDRLKRMIADVLDISKIEAGRLSHCTETVDL